MENQALREKALQLRKDVARMIGAGKPGHLGGSCSLADIVTYLYYEEMKLDPTIQYAALGDLGFFPKEEEKTLKVLGSRLQGHPDLRKLPGIEANTGSLGQGISMAAGMAAGLRIDKLPARVYCCLGDGELAEGQVWEAFMSAGVYKLVSFEEDKQFVLERNENWYGWTDGKHEGQYQPTKIIFDIIPEHKSKWVAQAHANVALARQANKNCNQHERRVLDAMQEDFLQMEKDLKLV